VKIKKIIASLAIAGGLVAVPAAAFGTISFPEGGTWSYGTSNGKVYSDYFHGKCHASSVVGQYYASSPLVGGGQGTYARAPDRAGVVDYSYYRFC
jgi:hypothetical protein